MPKGRVWGCDGGRGKQAPLSLSHLNLNLSHLPCQIMLLLFSFEIGGDVY